MGKDHPDPNEIALIRKNVQDRYKFKERQAKEYCAKKLHVDVRVWQRWENGERRMHRAFFDLATISTSVTDDKIKPGKDDETFNHTNKEDT